MEVERDTKRDKQMLDQQWEMAIKAISTSKGSEMDNYALSNLRLFMQRRKRYDLSLQKNAGGDVVEAELLKQFKHDQKFRKMMNKSVFLVQRKIERGIVSYLVFRTENDDIPYYYMFVMEVLFTNPQVQARALKDKFVAVGKVPEDQSTEIKNFLGLSEGLEIFGPMRGDTLIQQVTESYMAPVESSFEYPSELPRGVSQKLRKVLNMKLVSLPGTITETGRKYDFYFTDKYDSRSKVLPADAKKFLVNTEPFVATVNDETAYEQFLSKHRALIEETQKKIREDKREEQKKQKQAEKVTTFDAPEKKAKNSTQGVKNAVNRYMRDQGYVFKSFKLAVVGEKLMVTYVHNNEPKISSLDIPEAKEWIVKSYSTGETSNKIGALILPAVPVFDKKSVPRVKETSKPVKGKEKEDDEKKENSEVKNTSSTKVKPKKTKGMTPDANLILAHKDMSEVYKGIFDDSFSIYPQVPPFLYRWAKENGVKVVIVMKKLAKSSIVYLLATHAKGPNNMYLVTLVHEFKEIMTFEQMIQSYYKNKLAEMVDVVKGTKFITFLQAQLDEFNKSISGGKEIGKTVPRYVRKPEIGKDKWPTYAQGVGY